MHKRLRFRDLRERGVVHNWVTLKRWEQSLGFPPGQMTGPNTRTWTEKEIDNWLESRPVAGSRRRMAEA
ncbi:hypothetical protein BH10PSE7_BH10PSE7_34020 [soil metagenome]